MQKIVTYMFVSVIIYCIISDVINAQNSNACRTPVMESGLCVPLRQCPSLFNRLLSGNALTLADREYLTRSQCGYAGNQPLVCCPDLNATTVDDILPRIGRCGLNTMNRIARGISAHLNTYPWMAMLEYSKPNNTKGVHCIGVLISKRHVLTAAHCAIGNVIPGDWNLTGVRLGEYDLLTNPDCENSDRELNCNPPTIDIAISQIIIHELYNTQAINRANDIALLKLQSEVVYTNVVQPICLPRSQNHANYNSDNPSLYVAGWHRNTSEYSVKLVGRVYRIDNDICNRLYNNVRIAVEETQLCGSSQRTTYESCLGLPGSPIMATISNNSEEYFYLVGVEAFGAPRCGLPGWTNVYTRITSFVDWIELNLLI